VPKPGESFERDGLHVEVLEADERRVHRVRITAITPPTE
jgi:CBS domain containing-hemolysin-like protein